MSALEAQTPASHHRPRRPHRREWGGGSRRQGRPAGSHCSQGVPGLRGSWGGSCLCEMRSRPPLWAAKMGHRSRPLPGQTHAVKRGRDTRGRARPNTHPRLFHLFLMNRLTATRDTLAPCTHPAPQIKLELSMELHGCTVCSGI